MFSLLYVDDEPGLLELGKLFLESTGEFDVTTALSAGDGLGQLAQRDFDAIVSDFQMPVMDGIELLKRVRKSFGSIPFVLFTGRGREEVVIEAINNGVDFYLQKGGDPKAQFAELAHKVRQAVTRRRAETALSDSEKRLADIINFLPDATFAIDTRGTVIAWNRAMERMTGVSSNDILGKGDYEYALPFYHERRPLLINLVLDDDPAITARYPFVKKEGKTLISEITIPHFNESRGAALWFTASPLYNRNGDVAGAIESIREITERKQAEENLVSVNREYTNLLDQIQDVYYFSDAEGRLERASRSMATLLGYDDIAECIGRNFAETFYFNPPDRKRLLEELGRKGKVTGYEVTLKRKDGIPVLIEASSHLCYDPAGKITGVEGTFHDITERKKSEEKLRAAYEQIAANEEELREQLDELILNQTALKKSEGKFRDLAEASPDMIWEMDTEGVFTYMSPLSAEIIGFTPEEIVGKPVFALVPKEALAPFEEIFSASVRTKKPPKGFDLPLRCRDGHVIITEIRAVVLADSDGRFSGFRGIARDITDKKKAADELQAANEQLVASDEELREQYDELASSERRIRISEARLQYMLGFYEYAQKSERELLEYAIEGAGIVTGSALGYLAFLNDDESELSMYAWSKSAMAECSMRDKPIVYKTEKTGLWGEAVRQRCAQITNDYDAPNPAKKGYPAGHPHIYRHMNVPLIEDSHIVLVAGVANKQSGYSENDVRELLLLMQGLWTILKQKHAEEVKKRSEQELRMTYEHLAVTDEELRGQYEELAASQAALQKSEMNFRTLVENAPDAIYIQTNTRFRYLNHSALRLLGATSADELLGTSMWDRIHPSFHERIRGRVKNLTVDLQPVELLEEVYVKLDGTPVDVEVKAVPFQYEGEHGVLVMLRDISARKHAETELHTAYEKLTASEEELRQQYGELASAQAGLQKNQQQLEDITGTVPGVVYQFFALPDGTMGLHYVSNRAEEILGISNDPADFFERFTRQVDPRDRETFLDSVKAAVSSQSPWDFTGRFIKPGRETIWLQGISRPFVRDNETVFSGFLLDITGRKQAEDELKLLKISADRSSDEVFWLEFSGRILYTNEAACRATGYSPAEFASMKIFDLDPDFRPGVWEASVADLRERKTQFITTRHRRKDGSIMDVEIVAVYVSLDEKEYSFAYVRDITDRKRAEAALQQANLVVENSPVVIFRWEAKEGWPVAFVSRNITQFGYTPEELMSGTVPFTAIVHPEDLERVAREVQTYSSQGPDEYQQEYRILTRDGDVRWIDDRTLIERDPEGRITHYQGIVIDITERKRTDEDLFNSQQMLQAVLDSIPQRVFWKDRNSVYLGCNLPLAQDTGYTDPGELIGKDDYATASKAMADLYRADDRLVMESGQPKINFEEPQIKPDGSRAWLRTTKVPLRNKAGTIIGVLGTYEDITDRKRTEESLRESEAKFRELTELLPQIVFETDTDMMLTFVNRQAYSALGYTPDEVKAGINALSCIDPSQHDLIRTNIRKLSRKEPFEHPEYMFIRKDGSTFPALIFADPVMRGGTQAGFRGIIIDISDRKRGEEALRESEEKYRTLVEQSQDGIIVVQDERIAFVNGALMEMIGYPQEDLLGHSVERFVAPEDAEIVLGRHRERMSGNNVLSSYEFSLLHKDGVTRIVVKMNAGIAKFRGKPAMIATFQNVTLERKREEALEESEEKYRTLVESSFDGIAIHQDGIVVYVNRTGARLLGSDDPSVFIGKPAIDIIAPAFREQIAQRIREAPESMQELIREQFLRLDGTSIDVDVMTKPGMWKGRPAAYVTFRDITTQLRAEEALTLFKDSADGASDQVFWVDIDGNILYVNDSACLHTGFSREELQAMTIFGFDLVVTPGRWQNFVKEIRQEKTRVFTSRRRKKEGGISDVEIMANYVTRNGREYIFSFVRDITGRKQAEAALRESEEKYRTLVEVNRDIIYSLSLDGIILYASPQTITLLGYRPDEMEGRNFSDFVHPNDVEELVRHIQEHFDEGKPVRSDQFRVRRNDGTYRWFEDKTIYATDSRGKNIIAGTIRDITEEKAGQDALRESEEKFRALVETTGDFIWETDAVGKYTYVSPQVRDILGYEPEDLVGRTPFDIMPRDEAEKISAGFNHLVASRLPVTGLENKAIRKDGSVVILETSGVVRTANDGSFLGYRGIDRDITVRKQAENALRDSEERTRTILNTAQAGIVLVDAVTHQIVDANKKALELIGLDRGSVVGTICHRFICPAERGKCPVTDLGQQVDTSERVLITAAGEEIPVLKTVVPVLLSGRNILIESFVDISKQKRSEAAIREANRKLNLLNSITRHDIRNQLMVAQGFAQLAALSKPDATVLDFLAKITTAIETIQRQIEFTKAYQELGVHAHSWFLLGEVISSVRPGKIALRNTCNPVEIYADPMIDKVFFNLFDNAMKYGERVTEVTVGCKETDDYLIITFADNGVGIPTGEKTKIFEKGYGKNTGLGLFLVREILAITDITIHETGTYGVGAVFEIIIPGSAYRRPEQTRTPAERHS